MKELYYLTNPAQTFKLLMEVNIVRVQEYGSQGTSFPCL